MENWPRGLSGLPYLILVGALKKRVLRDGVYPHKVLNLFALSSLWKTGEKRQAIDTLRGNKIRSRGHVIVFVSYMSNTVK